MTSVVMDTERDQVVRWMEEGRHILDIMGKLLNDFDAIKETAEGTQKENEALRRDCDLLREEITRLKADNERNQKDRAEIAQWFSSVMSEAASRLLVERPPA
jgi:regulator of replication initiation timing